jgi:hypothetical protein
VICTNVSYGDFWVRCKGIRGRAWRVLGEARAKGFGWLGALAAHKVGSLSGFAAEALGWTPYLCGGGVPGGAEHGADAADTEAV